MQLRFLLVGIFLYSVSFGNSIRKDSIPVNMHDVQSIGAIINSLYDVISGDSAVKRNWDRMRTLFIPEGRLISSGTAKDGTVRYRVMSVEDYIRLNAPYLEKSGFYETELSKKTERFGNIAHVFSTYQSKHKLTDAKPFARGINSIQLLFDNKRWWIVGVYWTGETPANQIPKKYLKQKAD